MTPEQLLREAAIAKELGTTLKLVLKKGFKRPKGFPSGGFVSEEGKGKVYSFDPDKVIDFVRSQKKTE